MRGGVVDTLTSAPVADVLARLFDEARAADGPLEERFAEVAADDTALAEFLALEAKDYNGYRTIPLPFGARRGNEISVRTA
jgi:hypothetical protein